MGGVDSSIINNREGMGGSGGGPVSSDVFPVVEDVVDRVGVLAFLVRFFGEESLFAAMVLLPAIDHGMGFPGPGCRRRRSKTKKSGPLKERVDVSHLG